MACGRFSAKPLAVFRPNLWTFFDQAFGRFSSKTLASFRPTPCPFFGQNIIFFFHFTEARRAPIRRVLHVRQILRAGFPNFTGSLPKFAPEAIFFLPKTKISTPKRSRFCDENRPQVFRAEGPRLRARSHSVLPCPFFVAIFWPFSSTILAPFLWPNFNGNWKRKTENG